MKTTTDNPDCTIPPTFSLLYTMGGCSTNRTRGGVGKKKREGFILGSKRGFPASRLSLSGYADPAEEGGGGPSPCETRLPLTRHAIGTVIRSNQSMVFSTSEDLRVARSRGRKREAKRVRAHHTGLSSSPPYGLLAATPSRERSLASWRQRRYESQTSNTSSEVGKT